MSLFPDQEFFEYRIMRLLGQGAFGAVYLAQDTLLDRFVAIKQLRIALQADEVAAGRFLQEARTAGGLNHPNIVAVYALRLLKRNAYLVMEYVDGGSLRAFMEASGPVPVDHAVAIAADVCDALAVTHARGIVHRDIKPENVLLTKGNRAKVSDFGIAHVPGEAGGLMVTQVGFQPGTLLYMSPEQILGKQVDDRCDVYQLGVLLYEMVTGQHPFDIDYIGRQARKAAGSNLMLYQSRFFELLSNLVCEGTVNDVQLVRPRTPDWLASVVTAAMSVQPGQRPTAKEVASALRAQKGIQTADRMSSDGKGIAQAKEHLARGVMFRRQGRWQECIQALQTALELDPECGEAHYNLGLAFEHQGRLSEALSQFQSTLRTSPHHADARSGIGKVYYMQGHLHEAVEELKTALRVDPNCAQAHATLAMIYGFQGKEALAVREYEAALAICPDEAQWHYMLGLLYIDQGLPDALRELQLAAGLGFGPAQHVIAQLRGKK